MNTLLDGLINRFVLTPRSRAVAILAKDMEIKMASLRIAGAAIAVSLAIVSGASLVKAEEASKITHGGKLYDNWITVIKAEKPTQTHTAWPASNDKKKGDVTWRCKSCHGWDYMGADGAYGSGSYQTGIKGIRGAEGADPAAIVASLKGAPHNFDGLLSDENLNDLAMFVSKGQVDMDSYIDRATKAVKGDAAQGAAYFNTVCANCHGVDGILPKDMEDSLGKQVSSNPWEVMHKIMNGQPGEPMPALHAFDRQIALDVMAHIATLRLDK